MTDVLAANRLFLADGVQPGNDEARRWVADELTKPPYHQQPDSGGGLLDGLGRWLEKLFDSITDSSTAWPGIFAAIVALLVLALGIYLARHLRRTPKAPRNPSDAVLGGKRLSATEFRDRAHSALLSNNFDDCVLDAMRAIAQRATERLILDDSASRTAHEVSVSLSAAFPDMSGELRSAADLFDAIAYGHQHSGVRQAHWMLDLEDRLAAARPLKNRTSPSPLLAVPR